MALSPPPVNKNSFTSLLKNERIADHPPLNFPPLLWNPFYIRSAAVRMDRKQHHPSATHPLHTQRTSLICWSAVTTRESSAHGSRFFISSLFLYWQNPSTAIDRSPTLDWSLTQDAVFGSFIREPVGINAINKLSQEKGRSNSRIKGGMHPLEISRPITSGVRIRLPSLVKSFWLWVHF